MKLKLKVTYVLDVKSDDELFAYIERIKREGTRETTMDIGNTLIPEGENVIGCALADKYTMPYSASAGSVDIIFEKDINEILIDYMDGSSAAELFEEYLPDVAYDSPGSPNTYGDIPVSILNRILASDWMGTAMGVREIRPDEIVAINYIPVGTNVVEYDYDAAEKQMVPYNDKEKESS